MRKTIQQKDSEPNVYPFSAIVGQDEMKLALILNVIDPMLGGVLIMGHRGTGKSTAVRGLAELLPQIWVVADCAYHCDPRDSRSLCLDCQNRSKATHNPARKLKQKRVQPPVVELPLGATEDRVCGSIDIERALKEGIKLFEPGLLARANRGFLYIDEVNLLEDHLVDLLLDVAVTGRHRVERESVSVEHPARFVLIGSGNPEEGELRPQLLDRFGLQVEITTENDSAQRLEIMERQQSFGDDRARFFSEFEKQQVDLRSRITRAQRVLTSVKAERELLSKIAEVCTELRLDGHRGELTVSRAARALAAFDNRKRVTAGDVRRVAMISLRHRLRREPFEERGSVERINQALDKVFGGEQKANPRNDGAPSSNGDEAPRRNGKRVGGQFAEAGRAAKAQSPAAVETKLESHTLPPNELIKTRLKLDRAQYQDPRNTGSATSRNERSRVHAKSKLNKRGGRYVRGTPVPGSPVKLALDATLRALALEGLSRDSNGTESSPGLISNQERSNLPLRFKQFSRKEGLLFIFAIDTSGSMALKRIERAREVAVALLRESYVKRDSVAILVFRGVSAEIALPPSRSILRAKRALDCLSLGGGTPLSAGIRCANELAKIARRKHGKSVLLLFTDGGANVPLQALETTDPILRRKVIDGELRALAQELKKTEMQAVVIDTKQHFQSGAELSWISEALAAKRVKL